MRILYNIASRSRPKAFFEVLDNIMELSVSDDYIICAKLDADDPCRGEYLESLQLYPGVILMLSTSRSKIDAINRNIPDYAGWDILINISDDQRFTVKGFDDIIRKNCEGNKPLFLHFPDQYKKAACSTLSIMTREYYNLSCYIYHPAYYSLWADVDATETAKLLNCYKYIPQVIHKHLHYSTTGAIKDALYKRNDTYKKDRAVYLQRRADNFGLHDTTKDWPTILIKYPSRGRWRLFAEALDNIYSTIRTHKFKILVTADTDDVEMNSPEVRELCKRYHNVEICYGDHKSKIEAVNANMNEPRTWDLCVLMSDDMRFTQFGWDVKMWESIRKIWPTGTDFFAHFNDGFVGEKLPTMNIVGREYFDRTGHLYHPSYKSVSCDAEEMYRAMMLERYHYFGEVYFNHLHPANLKEPSDHVYRRNHVYGDSDTQNYFERLRTGFGLGVEKLPEELKQYV